MNPLEFTCPNCSKSYRTKKRHLVGHKVECSGCGKIFRIGNKSDKVTARKKFSTEQKKKTKTAVTPSQNPVVEETTFETDKPKPPQNLLPVDVTPKTTDDVPARRLEPITATVVDETVGANAESELQEFAPIQTSDPNSKAVPTKNTSVFRYLFIVLGIAGFAMLIVMAVLSATHLPEKIRDYAIFVPQPEVSPQEFLKLSRSEINRLGKTHIDVINEKREADRRNSFNEIMKRHPELFGILLIALSLIGLLRGFWGLASGSIIGRLGRVHTGQSAKTYSKVMIVIGGVVMLVGQGFIIYWLLI